MARSAAAHRAEPAGLRLRFVGPDASAPGDADLRRLFRSRGLTRRRRARLRTRPKVIAVHGDRLVGLAAYDCWGDELHVHELACAADLSFSGADVIAQLLECLELAAVAGGVSRVVILPWAVLSGAAFDRLGYQRAGIGRRGFEKLT